MSNRFPIDEQLVARADYAYNPRPQQHRSRAEVGVKVNVTRWNHIIEWDKGLEVNLSRFEEAPNGDWIDAQDHLTEVQRLQQRIAPLEAEIATLHASNEGASAEVGRLREQVRLLKDALAMFVDHFGDPFKTARAALAATEPRP